MSRRSFRLSELAALAGLAPPERDLELRGAAGLAEAGPEEIAFARAGTPRPALEASCAGALLVAPGCGPLPRPHLVHENPRYLFCLALGLLRPPEEDLAGSHPTAVVAGSARLGDGIAVGAFAVIGDEVEVGARARIGAHCVIEAGAVIGADTRLEPRVVVHGNVRIGARCHLHAGCVVGSEGFGFEAFAGRIHRMPHLGLVVIGDEVEIGANAAIDRGTTGDTVIAAGTKIDNLVQIGHNVRLGRNCIVAAQTGIAGTAEIGDGVVMGGRTSIADHAKIGPGARLGGLAAVYSAIPPGAVYSGDPARSHRDHLKEMAALRRLPALLDEIRRLRARLAALEGGFDTTREEP